MSPRTTRLQWLRNDWILLSSIVVFVVVVGYALFTLIKGSIYVPREFFEARGKGAVIAEDIVKLSGESINNLQEISRFDGEQNYSDGLDLVLKEIPRNGEARKSALALSEELGKMANTISEVKPYEASQTALQAVVSEMQIAQRLIDYNSYLYQLLDLLRSRFSKGQGASNQAVADLIAKMNGEISSINDLNTKYKILMAKFDGLTASR